MTIYFEEKTMRVDEIAPDLYRISNYIPEIDFQFNQFLVVDDEPLLFHTGMKGIFPLVRDAVAQVLDPSRIRWIGFSHFEADECGSLNEWLTVAPEAAPVCSFVGALVSVNDFASRPARGLSDGEVLKTGKYSFRFLQTPHVPHCWEAGLLFEETNKTLFCSDLFYHHGDVDPRVESDVVGRFRNSLIKDEAGPFANAYSYNRQTSEILQRLAALGPQTIAVMHGSSFTGDGAGALLDLESVMREILDN